MADNIAVKSKRDEHLARMREKYPDKKFEDDEEIYGQISEDYEQYEQELDGYRGREKTLADMFAADPRSAQFLSDMHNGKSPWANYIRIFGPELKDGLDDPETLEQIAEAEKDYVERVAKSRELENEYTRNLETSIETLRSFQSQHGMSDDEIDEVVAALLGIVRDGVMGKFETATLEMMVKAIKHDADVDAAAMEGEVAGRNSKIKEELRKRQEGDGTAPLGGRNGSPVSGAPQRPKSVFDLAAQAR